MFNNRKLLVETLESRKLLAADLVPLNDGGNDPQISASSFAQPVTGIVSSIVKAPVASDGSVAGAATDIVINLDVSMDPTVPGKTLLQGKTIKVVLPDDFVDTGNLPLQDIFSSPTCTPGTVQCNTGILVQGWPQRPVLPAVPPIPGSPNKIYSMSREGTNTIVYTAEADIIPGAVTPPGPGIKQLHLLLEGYLNPKPGNYEIQVFAETGPGGSLETGTGHVKIHPKIKPSINVASAYNPGSPNTIYQTAAPGAVLPLPYDFLLWGHGGDPLTGVEIQQVNKNHAKLVQGSKTVGHVHIDAPKGAIGQEVTSTGPSAPTLAPLTGFPTARMTAGFRVGSETGEYVLTFSLNGGTSVQMFVTAENPPSLSSSSAPEVSLRLPYVMIREQDVDLTHVEDLIASNETDQLASAPTESGSNEQVDHAIYELTGSPVQTEETEDLFGAELATLYERLSVLSIR